MSGVTRYEFEVDDRYLCDCGNGSRIIPVAIDTGEYVLASDYDRDTQALKDELDNIKRSWGLILSQRDALAAERSWAETELPKWRDLAKETRIERDELRARVEAMRMELNEVLAMYPIRLDRQSFVINGGAALCADGDDEFYSAKKINEVLGNIRACINAALREDKT